MKRYVFMAHTSMWLGGGEKPSAKVRGTGTRRAEN